MGEGRGFTPRAIAGGGPWVVGWWTRVRRRARPLLQACGARRKVGGKQPGGARAQVCSLRRRLLPPPLATLQAPEASKLFLFLFGVTSASRLGSPERPLLFKKEVRLGWRMSRIHLHSEWGLPYVT